MPEKPSIVINSSPLIALAAALPEFNLLSGIVEKLVVPGEVLAEVEAGGCKDDTAALVQAASWCQVRPLLSPQINPLVMTLGRGEAAVIQIALDEDMPLVAIDEVRGRRAARLAGLTVIGSLGMLLELKRAGLLASVTESIGAMRRKGIHLSPHLIDATLSAAGEVGGSLN